jgi:transposase
VEVNELIELKRQGLSTKAISAATGFDRKTIRKYLAAPEAIPAYAPRPPRPGKLEPFQPYLRERLSAGVWNGVVLLRELKARGYTGGYTTKKSPAKKAAVKPPAKKAVRVVQAAKKPAPPTTEATTVTTPEQIVPEAPVQYPWRRVQQFSF